MITMPHETLRSFMRDTFVAVGVPQSDAEICADVLITADLLGIDSHGIGRLKPIYIDRIVAGQISPTTTIEIVKETPTTAVIDGHNGMGQVIAKRSMEMAIEKAKAYGLGMVAVRNSNHYGIAGYYVRMAAEQGMIGITGTNARPSIAPTFGVENMLGTNPLTFGIPTDEPFPFMLDCATSITQRGKIEVYARLNKPLPQGWVISEDGTSKTNPHEVLEDLVKGTAALLPLGGMGEEMGGYKGYGYATVVEILSAALQQGAFLKALSGFENGQKVPYKLGHFFLAIHIEAFTELSHFTKTTGEILRSLRSSKKAPGHHRIYTAGEKEYETMQKRLVEGIPLDEEEQKDMIALRDKFRLPYRFPFEA
ncbi:MAG: Ldh family oxidoreductase [Brevinematales bacterium]|nr:Ldh family oxidoreductase [Brevinematales bacterium]